MQRGAIKPGQPHRCDDDKLEFVIGFTHALLNRLVATLVPHMMRNWLLVSRRSRIDNLECTLFVRAMCPAGPQPDDFFVQQRADLAAVAYDQTLTWNAGKLDHLGSPRLPVAY